MGIFERYLSVWVGLGILAGVGLGLVAPGLFEAVARMEWAHVNLVVAVFIWVMIYPMMVQIDFAAVKDVGKRPRGLVLTLVVNWLIKPFTMAALAVLFFEHVFAGWVDPVSASEYIAGMILLGVAPCTAMVFVWSQMTKGDPNYTLVQVSVNDLVMVFAFAPIAAFLLGVTDVSVPWETLLLSVVLYVVLPLAAGVLTRHAWLRVGPERLERGIDLEAVVGGGTGRHRRAAVRLPGRHPRCAAVGDRPDRRAPRSPVLRHLLPQRARRALASAAARDRCAGVPDRHLELLRARGGGGHLAVRAALGRCARDRGRRARRGSRDAVTGGDREPDAALVSAGGASEDRHRGGNISPADSFQ